MIKTDNGTFYMTAGEACYIARSAGDLDCVWFGARIEPEDEIYSVVGKGKARELELVLDGKRTEIVVDSFETTDKPDYFEVSSMPTIRGGKTLVVHMTDGARSVKVDLIYTPYPRGGITRRVVVRNVGSKAVSVKAELCVPAVGQERREKNFIAISGDGTLGVCAVYGGKYDFEYADGVLKCGVDEAVKVFPGGLFVSPEILCVHTDGDDGCMARIFHDIVREHVIDKKYFGVRRPLPLLCPSTDGADLSCAAAKQLGADSLIVEYGKSAKNTKNAKDAKNSKGSKDAKDPEISDMTAVAEKCKGGGIMLGVAFDVSEYADIDKAAENIERVLDGVPAEIVVLRGLDGEGGYKYWQKAYSLVRGVAERTATQVVAGFADLGSLCYCALCAETGGQTVIPPCARSKYVKGEIPSPKTEFDVASLGCLGYAFPVDKLNDDIKRAVRAQVFSYQDDADLIMNGDLYEKVEPSGETNVVVSKDKSSAYAVFLRGDGENKAVKLYGLDTHNLYCVRELGKTFSGAALRYVGVDLPDGVEVGETLSFHLMQVVDYD